MLFCGLFFVVVEEAGTHGARRDRNGPILELTQADLVFVVWLKKESRPSVRHGRRLWKCNTDCLQCGESPVRNTKRRMFTDAFHVF